jgi:hypothetical protein
MVVAGFAVAQISRRACSGDVLSHTHASMCGTAGGSGFQTLIAFGFPALLAVAGLNTAARRSIHLVALALLSLDAVLAAWIAGSV